MKNLLFTISWLVMIFSSSYAQELNSQTIESNSFEVMANAGYLWNDVSYIELGGELTYNNRKALQQGWLLGIGAHRAQNNVQQRFQTRVHLEAGLLVSERVVLSGYGNLIYAQDRISGESRNYFRPEMGISFPFHTLSKSKTTIALRIKGKYGYDFGDRFYNNPPHNFTISLSAGLGIKQVNVR